MLFEQVAALEKRATIAEAQLKKAQETLSKGSTTAPAAAAPSSDAATLARLQQLQKLIVEDRQEAEAVRAQRDELLAENAKLREQVGKLNYRVDHLLKEFDKVDPMKK